MCLGIPGEVIKIKGKRVLVRVDFNVPEDEKGRILDDSRIKVTLPTISYLLKQEAKVILVSHLGRPKGKKVFNLRLAKVAERLKKLLGIKKRIKETTLNGFSAYQISEALHLLENIRFYKEEEKNDLRFAKKLAKSGDIFVNEAFSCSHRAHASIFGITHFLPSFAGFYLGKEVKALTKLLKNPQRPFVCILGGAKVSDKIGLIQNLSKKVDWFLLGGVMANTFLASLELDLKDSVIAKDKIAQAKKFLAEFGEKIILPSDLVFGNLKEKRAVLDIGERDVEKFSGYINKAKTIFWNGNLGMTEKPEYAKGSEGVAKKIASSKALSVVAGGDTVSFIQKLGLFGPPSKFSFVSLGGGATLEFLAGKKLPALESLV